jgi:hypothetical protein
MCGCTDHDSIGATLRPDVGYGERTAPYPALQQSGAHVGENPQPVMGFVEYTAF